MNPLFAQNIKGITHTFLVLEMMLSISYVRASVNLKRAFRRRILSILCVAAYPLGEGNPFGSMG